MNKPDEEYKIDELERFLETNGITLENNPFTEELPAEETEYAIK